MVIHDPNDPFLACTNCGHTQEDHGTDRHRMFVPQLGKVVMVDHFGCVGSAPDPCGCCEFEHDIDEIEIDDRRER